MVATGTTTCVVKLQRNNNTATGAATLSVSGTTAGNVGTSALTIP
jgi:hypothetical protein